MNKVAKFSLKNNFGTPEGILFEHFLPWIWKIMQAFQDQEEYENKPIAPEGLRYS